MKIARWFALSLLLPVAAALAAETTFKFEKSRSYVDVDVDATKNFTARLENFEGTLVVEGTKLKSGVLSFKFSDLKTGDAKRDADLIAWLGGGEPTGRFEASVLAIAPDGQGQVSGRLAMAGQTDRVEFPVNVTRDGDNYIVTGQATLDYRDWGLKVIRKAFLFSVNPEVKIRFKFTASPVKELPSLVPPMK